MKHMMSRISPGATTMIRADHTHALATFHKYRIDATPERKQAIAETLCLAASIRTSSTRASRNTTTCGA